MGFALRTHAIPKSLKVKMRLLIYFALECSYESSQRPPFKKVRTEVEGIYKTRIV